MSEEIKATINRFIERRETQIVEMEVIKMTHELKKKKLITKEDKAKADMSIIKLEEAKAELVNEIALLKELLA